jgi:hypothetical protein
MALFKKNRGEGPAPSSDTRVYAFIGLGMMARFMADDALSGFMDQLPGMIARNAGTPGDNVVVVPAQDWASSGGPENLAIAFEGGATMDPEGEQRQCEAYLKSHGLRDHVVGDIRLLGVLEDGTLKMGTDAELERAGVTINGVTILFTAWLAFHSSAFA